MNFSTHQDVDAPIQYVFQRVSNLMAKSMRARVMLQSLKLAKSNLNRRFAKRVREQVSGIAGDYKRGV